MYVYTTVKFDEKVEQYRLQERFASLRNRIENSVEMHILRTLFEPFSPYWKRREGKLRLLARLVSVGEERVLCLLDVLQRGDSKYEQLLIGRREFGSEYLDPLLSHDEIEQWLKAQKTSVEEERRYVQHSDPLPNRLYPWLEPPGWKADVEFGEVIYESEEWVSRFRSRKILDFWQTYYRIVLQIVQPDEGEVLNEAADIRLASENGRYVLFSRVEVTPRRSVLFLLAPFKERPSEAEVDSLVHKIGISDSPTNVEELMPLAWRSYPAYLLADEESWLTIERDGEANLALSTEEEQLLWSVSRPTRSGESVPLFINGRAGSGKSTMLLYLFADYCARKQEEGLPGSPLFLTYNEALLEVAKDGVGKILSSHHRFLGGGTSGGGIEDAFFQPFQAFLLNLLPLEEREFFLPERYISFYRFKRLYTGEHLLDGEASLALRLPEAKRWTPELCWYVIRTFIKGHHLDDLDEYTDPDAYRELPRRDRTIDEDTYERIYETIWSQWYEHNTTKGDYWDDQDLIRRVLELECYHPEYTAIFCDEAQDFTRLELQLVMRLSVFSRYNLGYRPILSLPFAFAGDPFQTLNPTGFRWKSVKAAFYEEVIMTLDPVGQLNLGMNFKELTHNYRSTPPVVRAINLIQLWRRVLLDSGELQPQECWRQGTFHEPRKFILDRSISAQELANHAENTIIIVPAEEGQEAAYVEQDSVLSQVVLQRKEGYPPKNVLSAIKAKGLEFDRVILYKFGEACDEQVWQLDGNGEGHSVEMEYFFNKLYVAASRAKKYLFVVDSEEGDRRLWRYAGSQDNVEHFLNKTRDRLAWEDLVGTICEGTADSVMEIIEQDPLSVAQELDTKGSKRGDPDLLRSAKQYYEDAGMTTDAALCEAKALRAEGNFYVAGELFMLHGKVDKALDCFWDGTHWPELAKWYSEHNRKTVIGERRELAAFMVATMKDASAIVSLGQFLEGCIGRDTLGSPFSKQWRQVVNEYIRRTSSLDERALDGETWRRMGHVLQALDKAGYRGVLEQAGDCYYRARDYQSAASCWEKSGTIQERKYYLAKAEAIGLPDGLEWLAKAGAKDRILNEWQRAGGLAEATDPRWLKSVVPVLEDRERYWEAFKVYLRLDDLERLRNSFEKSVSGLSDQHKWEGINSIVTYSMRRRLWTEALDAVDKYFPLAIGHDEEKAILRFNILREFAYSGPASADLEGYGERFENLVGQVLPNPHWQQYLSIEEVGSAFERIGRHIDSLQFYERFIDSSDPGEREFARRRWIVNKRRQVNYYQNREGRGERIARSRSELVRRHRAWRIPEDIDLPEFPKLPPRAKVQGVPWSSGVEELGGGVSRFQIDRVEVSINEPSKLVLITDRKDFTTLRVDLAQGKVSGQAEAVREDIEDDGFRFEVPASGYSGIVRYGGKKPQLELSIQAESVTIFL